MYRLTPTPPMESRAESVSTGLATLFDLDGSLTVENPNVLPTHSDAEAIFYDWIITFNDLQHAFYVVVNDDTPQEKT